MTWVVALEDMVKKRAKKSTKKFTKNKETQKWKDMGLLC